jgi:cellulose biosynthesis protein BcsQ
LALKGKRVLIIDGSSQANATTAFRCKPNNGLAKLLLNNAPFAEVIAVVSENLGVLTGGRTTASLAGKINPLALRRRLQEVEGYLDYIIIDTSPTIGDLHVSFYAASDYIVIPTQLHYYSVQSVVNTVQDVERSREAAAAQNITVGAKVLAISPTMWKPVIVQQQNLEYLQERFGEENVLSPIKLRKDWEEAAQMRTPIFTFDALTHEQQWRIPYGKPRLILNSMGQLPSVIGCSCRTRYGCTR